MKWGRVRGSNLFATRALPQGTGDQKPKNPVRTKRYRKKKPELKEGDF